MSDTDRQISWRQGDALTDEAAKALNLQHPENSGGTVVVVISHDCDLTAVADKEPVSEVIVGQRIDRLGGDSYGKTARRLHIEYQTAGGPVALELMATAKRPISKPVLFATDPRQDMWLDGRGVAILQRWLAARYYRAAFPEAFEDRLRAANIPGKRTFLKKLESILVGGGDHIRALLFDLDEGKDVEREAPEDLYQLGIMVLYDSLRDEPTAAAAATKAAEDLEELFDEAFHLPDVGWQNICLKYCDPVSDSAITVAEREILKQWRLEHMSLQDDQPQPMITP
ncbi:hypothetical protein FEMY_05400 [Ferrovum myxofaciens]|jgi:hypothetical protein|uniref:Uncharacterized protein n=1 Tax=Ferrovum myxofaciens TaxID=416213 RepID=A0A149W041_9PROT|nr:hypothetical protein [Ferrovum myxofaciens]KXW58859.1 hypothetical protein FEMY_05400 [Ferrovum myxofaciens]